MRSPGERGRRRVARALARAYDAAADTLSRRAGTSNIPERFALGRVESGIIDAGFDAGDESGTDASQSRHSTPLRE